MAALSTDSGVVLMAPEEFTFLCESFAAGSTSMGVQSIFPSVDTCDASDGYLSLSFSTGFFLAVDSLMSFRIDVMNPSLSQAAVIQRRRDMFEIQSFGQRTTEWALFLQSRGVTCQAAHFEAETMSLYLRPLHLESLSFRPVPNSESFVQLHFRFAAQIPGVGSVMYVECPGGFTFLGNFSTDALLTGADESLEIGSPMIPSDKLQEVQLPLTRPALPELLYGFRGRIRTPLLSPDVQQSPSSNRWNLRISTTNTLEGRFAAGSLVGLDVEALRGCDVKPVTPVYAWDNEIQVSLIVSSSFFSSATSIGRLKIVAPTGFTFPTSCVIQDLGTTQTLADASCRAAENIATVELPVQEAIPRGHLLQFSIALTNPEEDPSGSHWNVMTYQGETKLEECEQKVPSFTLARRLDQAFIARNSVGQDLRPGQQSVYQFVFTHPARTSKELTDIAAGFFRRSTIRLTLPTGYTALPNCLQVASGTDSAYAALPDMLSCICSGQVLEILLNGLVEPGTSYALSLTVGNPPASNVIGPNQWKFQVDGAAVALEGPALRSLKDLQVMPSNAGERSEGFVLIYFRTDAEVPVNGRVDVYVPAPFVPSCPLVIYDAGTNALGDAEVSPGSPCILTSPATSTTSMEHHILSLQSLSSSLQGNSAFLLTLRVRNADLQSHQNAVGHGVWWLSTGFGGDVLDRSMEVASFTVKRHLGEVKFVEPSLTSPVGNFYPMEVKLTLWTTIRSGSVVFYPPSGTIFARCPDEFPANAILPSGVTCFVEGRMDDISWRNSRVVLQSLSSPWSASRPYTTQLLVHDAGAEIPAYRRTWIIELIAQVQNETTQQSISSQLAPLPGFLVATTSVEQWRWRGWLSGLSITSQASQGTRSPARLSFIVESALMPNDEIWIRGPKNIILHPFSCLATFDPNEPIPLPIPCEVPVLVLPCVLPVYETDAGCLDTPDAVFGSAGFAHRNGMRIKVQNVIGTKSPVQIDLDITPIVADISQPGIWLVSSWRGSKELDMAYAAGFPVWHWMEITQFRAADLQPEVLTTIQMEWWMLSPLDAGGALQIHSPGSGLAFDLSVALQRWSFGNVPVKDATDFSQVEARKALLQISLCCELLGRTAYHLSFGVQNPSAQAMPLPARGDLNAWKIQTLTSLGILKHFGEAEGYRLSRPFRKASVTLENQLLVGGVGDGEEVGKVTVSFSFPSGIALHQSSSLRLLAPDGWQFLDKCESQLGQFTSVTSCTAARNELTLSVSGSLNPGIEGRAFGFQAEVKAPKSVAVNNIWFLEAYGAWSTSENLVDRNRDLSDNFVLEPRIAGVLLGANVQGGDDMVAKVTLTPDALDARNSATWRLPSFYHAEVQLILPSLPERLPNATLLVTVDFRWAQLRCSYPPRPFEAGSLPAGALCYDNSSATDLEGREVLIAFDNIIPLRSGIYNFSLVLLTPSMVPKIRGVDARSWPRETAWSLSLGLGALAFRSTVTSVEAVEGQNLPSQSVTNLGVATSNTKKGEEAQIDLLLQIPSDLVLPISLEIETPYGFRLDTSPSPLHPALQSANANILGGINPFRSQRWDVSSMRNPSDQLEPERVLCSLLQTKPASHTFNEVGSNPAGLDSICTAPFAGNLGMSMLTACMEEAYVPLPAQTACYILANKAVIELGFADNCPGCPRNVLPAGRYYLSLRGYNPSKAPATLEEDSPRHSWKVTIFSHAANRVAEVNFTSSPFAYGSVPNFILEDTLRPNTIWRGPSGPSNDVEIFHLL